MKKRFLTSFILLAVVFAFVTCASVTSSTAIPTSQFEHGFYVNYSRHVDGFLLTGRDAIQYGDGAEKIIILSDVELHEFKIFNIGADFLNGDVNFTRDVLLPSTYLEYSTYIPDTRPAEAVFFKTADQVPHYYWLGYDGENGFVISIPQEIPASGS